MLEDILKLHQSGQLELAENGYRELLAFNPDDPEALHLLGILRRQCNDFREGMELVARAVELMPERANFHMTLGGMRMHARLWDEAYESFSSALKLNPNLTSAYSALGQIAMLRGDAAVAESNFKVALKAEEDDPQVLASLGNLHMSRGESEQALKYLTRAVELRPDDAAIQASVGRAFYARGMADFAETALQNALKLRPDYPVVELLLGELRLKANRFSEAKPYFDKLVAAGEHLGPAYAALGDIARAENDLATAVGHYRASLTAKPRQAQVILAQGWCLRRSGQVEAALELYRQGLLDSPGDLNLSIECAGLLSELGRHNEVAGIWRERLTAQPNDDAARVHLALSLEWAGQWEEAAKVAEQVATLNNVELAFLLVRAALRQKLPERALKLLDEMNAAVLNSTQVRWRSHYLGLAHDQAGQPAAAVAAWQTTYTGGAVQLPFLEAVTAAPMPAADANDESMKDPAVGYDAQTPIFLVGAPGSGVDRVAALLSDQSPLALLSDRFGPNKRSDGFSNPDFNPYPDDADAGHRFARRYRRALERLAIPAQQQIIDWLPHFDARFFWLSQKAWPNAKWILVQRDARDALLNWLAYGWSAGYEPGDLGRAAHWFKLALQHQSVIAQAEPKIQLLLNSDEPMAHITQKLKTFLGLAQWKEGVGLERATTGIGGLPITFPAGHWKIYSDILAESFSIVS